MVPALRTKLNGVSAKNVSLQDILKSCNDAATVADVSEHYAGIHNTKLTLLLKNGEKRVHFYNRLSLKKILEAYPAVVGNTIDEVIENLNLLGFDFTTDDIDLVSGSIVAKPTSLGYYSEAEVVELETITAVYDSFYQTMAVTGQSGLLVETSDGNGVIIGSGVIGSDGSVTYPINEDNHDRSVPIYTKAIDSNVVEHKLTVSFYAEMSDAKRDVGRFNPWGMFTKEILQRAGQSNNAWDNVQFDEHATGRVYVQWNWDNLESIKIYTLEEIRAMFTVRYGADFYPDDEFYSKENSITAPTLKVRFDVDTPIILGLACTDTIHQFYDDGTDTKTIGYRFGLDFGADYPLRKVPAYLPKSIKNLDFMFASGGLKMFENEAGAANLNLWDVGYIVTMNSTFAETDDLVIPISNWRPVKLTSMRRFLSATSCLGGGVSDISAWHTPLLSNIDEAFLNRYNNTGYVADLSQWCVPLIPTEPVQWDSGQMIPPVWGTCPVR